MIEKFGNYNIFAIPKTIKDAAVVTTNGVTKRNGQAVMGAGIAKYARDNFPGIDTKLGHKLLESGNHAYNLGTYTFINQYYTEIDMHIFSMPTKHDWKDDSDLALIEQSCHELMTLCDAYYIKNCYMPCPGCKNGHLNYQSQVRPILERILDDRFIVVVPYEHKRPF